MRRAARPAPLMQLLQLLRRLMGQPESLCHSRLGVRGQLWMSKIRLQEQQGFAWVAAVTVVENFLGEVCSNLYLLKNGGDRTWDLLPSVLGQASAPKSNLWPTRPLRTPLRRS